MALDTTALEHLRRDDLVNLYTALQRSRLAEERVITLFRQGEIVGGVFTAIGMEAIAVGYAYCMGPDDVVPHTHRCAAAVLMRHYTLEEYFCQWLGRANGIARGRDGNMHFGDPKRGDLGLISHMATGMAAAVGAALAFKLRGEPRVAVAPFGDGAASTGYAHETMNLAAVMRLPVVFVLNNNQYAMSTPLERQTVVPDLAERGRGYGIPAVVVDGNDVLAVYGACRKAFVRARSGGGPTLIECKTMRMRGHSEADNADYVPRELLLEWAEKDPVRRYAAFLAAQGVLDDAGRQRIVDELAQQVERAVAFAQASPFPEGSSILDGVYADPVEG